jgi:hypothetical protein
MGNPTKPPASHGQGGQGTETKPVPEHETWGGGDREEAAGGSSGRGNEEGATADTRHTWSTGKHSSDPKKQEPTRPGMMGPGAEEPTGG